MVAIGKKAIALGARLKKCRNVLTLGVKANFFDYSYHERKMIAEASTIYFPSTLYANLFVARGKRVFPSCHNYDCAQDKIKQSTSFQLHNLPHPKTRFFYGKKQQDKILDYFQYPFIAKIPRGSAMGKGVFMIRNYENLKNYLERNHVAYIQEYLPISKDIRIVVIGSRVVNAYWRIMKFNEFRSNVALGGRISFDHVPHSAINLALDAALKCKWDDVGVDVCQCRGRLYLLEANMKYGREGFVTAGIDYIKLMEEIVKSEYIQTS